MSLEIIIKTCDGESIHGKNEERFCKADKKTIIAKCISSIMQATIGRKEKTRITVIDDYSSEECQNTIQKLLESYPHEAQFYTRDVRDYNEATLQYFDLARESEYSLVYCVEDDYLHFPYAIAEMEDFYNSAFMNLNGTKDIALHPFDDPNNYLFRHMITANIVQGKSRHWRTNVYTPCTFMTTPGVINRNWTHFENFANGYGKNPKVSEETTISHVWNSEGVQLFTPLPSLALHMQFEKNRDKMLNWKPLWDSIPNYI
jgi:glycosyltransferase involved in cell wall biosynthesis